jgi:hypothetical protein
LAWHLVGDKEVTDANLNAYGELARARIVDSWRGGRGDLCPPTRCVYTPNSVRAITETLLLDAGVGIIRLNELPGRGQVTTTQICDKGRRSFKVGESHDVPI